MCGPAVRVGKATKALEQLGDESHALDLFEILGEDMGPSVEEVRRWAKERQRREKETRNEDLVDEVLKILSAYPWSAPVPAREVAGAVRLGLQSVGPNGLSPDRALVVVVEVDHRRRSEGESKISGSLTMSLRVGAKMFCTLAREPLR